MRSLLGFCMLVFLLVAAPALATDFVGPAGKAHQDAKVTCQACHKDQKNKPADSATCLNCHGGYKTVAARTAQTKPNPHESHMGELRCTLCHSMHKASKVYCNECHTFPALKLD